MSKKYSGGIISATAVVPSGPYNTSSAPGVWTLEQQAQYAKQGIWPTAGNLVPTTDLQFNYVTMLLHGDGTNGAQNNTFVDGSINNYSVTRNGNSTQGSFSPFGSNWSNNLNGSSSFSLSNNTALDMGTGDFTLEFWVFSTDASIDSQYRRFVVTGTNSTSAIQVGHIGATSGVVAYTADDATLTITGTTNVLNTWAHIAVVRQSGTVKLYVNGTSEGTPITDSNSKTTSNFNIGRYPGLSGYLNGNISNIRLVKGTAVYTSNFTPSTTPLTAISGTSLLTCQSNTFKDNSTNNFTITVNNAPSVQRFNPFGTSTAYSTSVIGGSGYFDGTGDWLTVGSNSNFDLGSGNFCIEGWIYCANVSADPCFASKRQAFTTTGWGFSTLYFTALIGGTWRANVMGEGNSNLSNNTWYHYCVTRSGDDFRTFKNGRLTSFNTFSGAVQNHASPLAIAAAASTGNEGVFQGYISNVRIGIGTIPSAYVTSSTTVNAQIFTPSTTPLSTTTGTQYLGSMVNGAIFDNAMMNDLETVGNAQISTSVVKYGTGSIYINSASAPSYLTSYNTNAINLGTGDFTIEAWIYPTQYTSDSLICKFVTGGNIFFFMINSGQLCIVTNGYTSPSLGYSYFGSLSLNTWTFVTLTRVSGTCYGYINGTKSGSSYSFPTAITPNQVIVGEADTNRYIGYIDDFRITKGYARYTATFTPPTAAFFNTGPV